MDDAPDSDQNMPVPVENGDVLPQSEEETTTTIINTDQDNNVFEKPKVNGEKEKEDSDKIDSSDCDPDTLIIDEKPTRKRKLLPFEPQSGFKGFKRIKSEEEIEPLTNPYFNESLFELSGLHRNAAGDASVQNNVAKNVNYSEEGLDAAATTSSLSISNFKKGNSKKKSIGSPKLREYAQYLGLQPTVQFKCPRCSQSGFQTLADLNAHHPQCMTQDPVVPTTSTASTTTPSTNFRVTRKVFLCSACGTYYENWNLFLHMRNIHNRFVCLYCLGMFSQPEKLTLHLASKHNCVPRHLTQEDFFREYKEPCYLMCCDCLTVFGETDDFYGHQCNGKSKHNNNENKSNKSTNSVTNRPSTSQKSVTSKINKQNKTKGEFVEHVTGDTQIVSSSNNNESDNLNESVGLNSLEVKNNITENSLPEEQTQEPHLEETTSNPIENQNEIVDTNNHDSNSRISMETDNEKPTNVETELSNHNNLEDFSQNKENSENVVTETKESASEEDEMEEDSNKSFDDKSRSPSPCDNNFDEDPPSEQPNYEETLNDINDFLHSSDSQHEDTRKVPKVTLKLPKIIQPYVENGDSEDSDKLTMELDSMDYENDLNSETNKDIEAENENEEEEEQQQEQPEMPEYAVAGAEIPITELELEQPLDKFEIKVLLQKCLKQTIPSCIYCNHARKIAVNGKQLALHAIAEHRFSAVVNSITAEELIPETFVMRIRESFTELESVFFSIESNADEGSITFSHIFECFQCRYATAVHKELYLHNRKMHAKTILLCIMCKSNFYSYSELICHLCPGIYESQEVNCDINFRCCMCVSKDLPSAFRLMVHLRKRHHICDVCLELCNNQSKLSNHVWKHKLHHICYRCGVAYRNKPDITKHLFWKHGTESVLCKKCLQKKWPHVYHFCIPPSTFTCEECNLNFSKAVALKVHKRMHDETKPHECTFEECSEKFISKRLLLKHEFKHREPPEDSKAKELPVNDSTDSKEELVVDSPTRAEEPAVENAVVPEVVEKKPKVDVYDLPALNLSESDTSDSEEEIQTKEESKAVQKEEEQPDTTIQPEIEEVAKKCEDEPEKMEIDRDLPSGSEILENTSAEPTDQILHVWDNFKNYQAKQIKIDASSSEMELDAAPTTADQPSSSSADGETEILEMKQVVEVINKDHDYCTVSETTPPEVTPNPVERSQSIDHDYCFSNNKTAEPVQDEVQPPAKVEKPKSPAKTEKKESKDTSDSSDDSDSSSCECNSNCSCSSSSDSSSSSSDSSESDSSSSEGRRKQQARRERRRTAKQRGSPKKEQIPKVPEAVKPVESHPQVQTEQQIEESDLYTSESETDEEFYDQQPQKLANKLMMEKRKMLLAGVNTNINGSILESSRPSTPSLPETEAVKLQKKKSKNKKKKKKNKKQAKASSHSNNYQFQYQQPIVSPLTLSLPKNSPCPTPTQSIGVIPHYDSINESIHSNDSSKRASKRRRIPNRFYGYSSDEEHEKYQPPVLKWPKADLPSPARQTPVSPQTVPPITIRTIPSFVPVEEPVVPRLVIPTPRENKTFQHFHRQPPIPMSRQPEQQDSCTETNESSSEEEQQPVQPAPPQPPFVTSTGPQPPLYCYCRCPYDEVSEMIGCDASDCAIEWFHFECVGIMVPPKGQWFCPDCRKKTQYAREYLASSPV